MRTTPAPNQIHISGSTRQQKLYDQAIHLLRLAEPPEGYYLATSFGKDSIVAHRLCDEAGVKYDAHHNHTGIDPPELVYFGRKCYPDVKRETYPLSMWRLIEREGIPPMRHIRYCCNVLKEDGGIGRTCVMGIRAEESGRRRKSWAPFSTRDRGLRLFDNDDITTALQNCNVRGKLTVSPLYDWTWADLWDLIRDRKLPCCELYKQGFDRLGCIGCPEAPEHQRRMQFARWPKYYDAYLRTFQRLIDAGRMKNLGTAEAIMEWWLSDRTQEKSVEGQMEME